MNRDSLIVMAPLILMAATAVAIMALAAFRRNHRLAALLTLAGLAASGLALIPAWGKAPCPAAALLLMDPYALFFTGLIAAAAFVVILFSYDYLERRGGTAPAERCEEYYLLLILATAGAAVLVSAVHFASFFLGLELLSVALYALVAYFRGRPSGIEAGIKYLVLAGVSSAFLLFGMALVYAQFGTMEFARLALSFAGQEGGGLVALAGVGMIVVGIGFKLSLAPFHLWAPDVYQGAPAPVAGFVAAVSKGAVTALLLRYVAILHMQPAGSLAMVFTLLAIASMFAGNWLALLQTNVKRILACSSIAHMGYVLVAFLASGRWASGAVIFYLAVYGVSILGAFGVVSVLSPPERDADGPEDYRGLAWRRPWLAGLFSAALLSLAGIPLTAGFVGKFYVLAAGVNSELRLLVIVLAVNSAIGLFYYLRLMALLYRRRAEGAPAAPPPERAPLLSSAALVMLGAALLWLGLYPAPLVAWILALGAS